MPNTYTQIHIQVVFAVKYREALINPQFEIRLQKYITGILQNHGHKMLAINSVPDHMHLFFGFKPHQSLSDLMKFVKGDSSEWINLKKLTAKKFRWQEGFGAFSYKLSDVPKVCKYIENQKNHHRKIAFLNEYENMLVNSGISYDKKYLFHLPI